MDQKEPRHRNRTAIMNLAPGAAWNTEKDGTILEWLTPDIAQPTEAEIDAEVKRLQVEYDTQAYARNRAEEYPSNGDQWDMIYKDNKNSTTTHADAVEAVKTKWPNDNSGPV